MSGQGNKPPSQGKGTPGATPSLGKRPRESCSSTSALAAPLPKRARPNTTTGGALGSTEPGGRFLQLSLKCQCLDDLYKQQGFDANGYTRVLRMLPDLSISTDTARKPLLKRLSADALKKKTLVLDMDHTMIHSTKCSFDAYLKAQERGQGFKGSGGTTYTFQKRPYLEEFLELVSQLYEVVVYTAGRQPYAEPLLDLLDPSRTIFSHRLYHDSCRRVPDLPPGNKLYYKDLSALGRDLASTFIVDDTPLVFAYNMFNGIPVTCWEGDESDCELKLLMPLMKELSEVADVRDVIKPRFRLHREVHKEFCIAPEKYKCALGLPPATYPPADNGAPSPREVTGADCGASVPGQMSDSGNVDASAGLAWLERFGDVDMTDNTSERDSDVEMPDSSFQTTDVELLGVDDGAVGQSIDKEERVMSNGDLDSVRRTAMSNSDKSIAELSETPDSPRSAEQTIIPGAEPLPPVALPPHGPERSLALTSQNSHLAPQESSLLLSPSVRILSQEAACSSISPASGAPPALALAGEGQAPSGEGKATSAEGQAGSGESQAPLARAGSTGLPPPLSQNGLTPMRLHQSEASPPLLSDNQGASVTEAERDSSNNQGASLTEAERDSSNNQGASLSQAERDSSNNQGASLSQAQRDSSNNQGASLTEAERDSSNNQGASPTTRAPVNAPNLDSAALKAVFQKALALSPAARQVLLYRLKGHPTHREIVEFLRHQRKPPDLIS